MNLLRNFWYVGCASRQLKSNPFATQIMDQKIVLFRDANGRAHALKDRCCHRGFPLSRGKINDGNLACGYHGWEYNGVGQCVKIPSQPAEKSIPKSHCVESFICDEKDEYIWVWMGQSEKTAVPSIPEVSSGNWVQGSRIVNCNYLRALEITYDCPHVYAVHPTHPATVAASRYGFAETQMELRITGDGCILFSPPTNSGDEPIPSTFFKMEFKLPGTVRFEFAVKGHMFFFTTPLTDTSCRIDWLITNVSQQAERILWVDEGREIIGQDQVVLELIQKAYDAEGEGFECSVDSDGPTLTLRRIVKAAEKGEWSPENFVSIKRKIINMMGPAGFY